jgi:hypothetical protein
MNRKLLVSLLFLAIAVSGLFYWQQSRSNDSAAAQAKHGSRDFSGLPATFSDDVQEKQERTQIQLQTREILQQSVQRLENWPALEANVRQKINLFGQQLVGPGRYVQAGQGSNKARLELTFKSDDFQAEIIQINDGRFLYIKNDAEKDAPMQRVDLRELDKHTSGNPSPAAASPLDAANSRWMAMGGLAHLLKQMNQDFVFNSLRSARIDDMEVLILEGTWNPQCLSDICGKLQVLDKAGRIQYDRLPPQLPTHIQVTLGNEEPLSLFPHQIVYLRKQINRQGELDAQTIASFEFFNVRPAKDLAASTFQIEEDATRLTDITDSMLKTTSEDTVVR